MSGIGHNNGPTMEAGFAWRKHTWAKARSDLLPKLPIEVVRRRVARAKELGLPYKTYASVRASTGRDVVGFLFSNNALRLIRSHDAVQPIYADKLKNVSGATMKVLVHRPLSAEQVVNRLEVVGLQVTGDEAPHFNAPWPEISQMVKSPWIAARIPADGVLVVGDSTHERLWSEAGGFASYLTSQEFFD